MPFPFAGPQSPTLLPNFSRNIGSNGRGIVKQSPAAFLAANPRVDATATVTVGGTLAAGDVATLTLTSGVFSNTNLGIAGGAVAVSYSVVADDSADTVAQALAAAVNEQATLATFGVRADAVGAVVTIRWPGPVGNFCKLAASATGEMTLSSSGSTLSGGSGAVLVWDNFQWTASGQVMDFYMGNFYTMSGVLAGVVAAGMPVQ